VVESYRGGYNFAITCENSRRNISVSTVQKLSGHTGFTSKKIDPNTWKGHCSSGSFG